ncbi:MAG: sulfatase [Acidobacteria bacterium]|nr:sulfatase [Acidobacteriota bacterium]
MTSALIPRLAAACLSVLLAACARPFDPAHEDIVLVVVDTLRADHLGVYGYARGTSPRLDGLAGRATVFDAAWSAAPWTLPSVMSIMTSRYPSSHRVENDGLKLADDVPTLAETLRKAGYATGGFVSHVYVSATFGFGRGFEVFDDFGLSQTGYRLEAGMEPAADRVTDAALAWLDRQGRRPVLLVVHYFDPHWPYAPPERYRALYPNAYAGPHDASYDSISKYQDPLVPIPEDYRRFLIDRYDGEIRFVDDQIGRLLDGIAAAGRAARTWVIVTADHGEEFKDHGSMGHGRRLYQEAVSVPLVIGRPPGRRAVKGTGSAAGSRSARAPKAGEAARVSVPAGGIDLFPTIAALAGVPPPAGLQGTSLVPLLRAGPADAGAAGGPGAADDAAPAAPGTGPAPDRPLVCETIRLNAHLKAVRRATLKLIQSMDENRTELYDLAADPLERQDLSAERPEERRALAQALFSQVDFLSGGWNVRWNSDGRKRNFQGQIRTSGIFRTIVPLFRDRGKYVLASANTLNFSDAGQAGASGLAFTIAPEDAQVDFYLLIDGRPLLDRIFLGGNEANPRVLPFALEGRPAMQAAFEKPPRADGRDLGYFIWHLRPAAADQEIVLDEEIRERLRSLGYIN